MEHAEVTLRLSPRGGLTGRSIKCVESGEGIIPGSLQYGLRESILKVQRFKRREEERLGPSLSRMREAERERRRKSLHKWNRFFSKGRAL